MDEREKLRKFRELDDAFAAALRELDGPGAARDIPAGPPVGGLDQQDGEPPGEDASENRQHAFERRLRELMRDYALPEDSVSDLLRTLQALDHIA